MSSADSAPFSGRLLLVGFGCIGQGVLPLLLRHLEISREQVSIIAAERDGELLARRYGVALDAIRLTPENFAHRLEERLVGGDFLVNLSVDVSSSALIDWCQRHGVLYLDTCIEPWFGHHLDHSVAVAERTNHALRQAALALRQPRLSAPTAVLTHGANPGLAFHFIKQALLAIAADDGYRTPLPSGREQWARLAHKLGIKAIQIAERDSQQDRERRRPGEFVNTWSVDAFVGESCQPAELGWGSHERHFPDCARRHASASARAIYLNRPGASTRVRTWTPLGGASHAFLVSLSESLAITEYFSFADGTVQYCPTAYYAYQPCPDTVLSLFELTANELRPPLHKRVAKDGITSGIDELGVLLLGGRRGAYWFGSRLAIDEARSLAPHNSATSLQVAASVVAGVIYAIANPRAGIIEPGDIDHRRILEIVRPYLGEVAGVYSDWTPLQHRQRLFEDDVDAADPWQFKNFLVT